MDMDKKMILVDLKVQINYFRQTMEQAQISFGKTQQAHEALMDKLNKGTEALMDVYEDIEKSHDN